MGASQRYHAVVDVHLFLIHDGQILLGERQNTGYEDGKYHVPAGHLEAGETLVDALVREAHEEIGIQIDPADVRFAHLMHHRSNEGRIAAFFAVSSWSGEVQNTELDKCAKLEWFDLELLPENVIPYARYAIGQYVAGVPFSLYGWAPAP